MADNDKPRRMNGTHITIVAVALAVVLAPTTVYAAASRVISILGDPYNSAAYARISEDGRLGIRGETTAQAGVPSIEWHRQVDVPASTGTSGEQTARLLHAAPAGSGIGVSQLIVSYGAAQDWIDLPELWLLAKPADGKLCPERSTPGYRPGVDEQVLRFRTPAHPSGGWQYEQLQFPVPLTVAGSATEATCLYAAAIRGDLNISANGVSGPAAPAFAPAKGEPINPDDKK